MRISDWSSDVCSSDLLVDPRLGAKRIADIGEARIFDPGGEIEQHRISPEIGALQIEILDRGISAVGEQRGPVIIGPDLHPPLIDADRRGRVDRPILLVVAARKQAAHAVNHSSSSERRLVGKGCVSKCRYRWAPYHEKNKN